MKKIICLILAVTMLMSMSLFLFSCDDGEDNNDDTNKETKVTYTVTVKDADGKAIKGAFVTFSPKGSNPVPYLTDKEGKATFTTDKELTATVTTVPKGYEYDKLGVAQSFGADGTLSVVLTKAAAAGDPFVIKVVDEQGNPIANVRVQMCDTTGTCRKSITTNAKGEAEYAYEEGDFHAQLTELPDGYTVDNEEAYYDFVDGVATITLTKSAD